MINCNVCNGLYILSVITLIWSIWEMHYATMPPLMPSVMPCRLGLVLQLFTMQPSAQPIQILGGTLCNALPSVHMSSKIKCMWTNAARSYHPSCITKWTVPLWWDQRCLHDCQTPNDSYFLKTHGLLSSWAGFGENHKVLTCFETEWVLHHYGFGDGLASCTLHHFGWKFYFFSAKCYIYSGISALRQTDLQYVYYWKIYHE